MGVNSWLNQFVAGWIAKDAAVVMDLFGEDVEYWETPHRKLRSFDELRQEWLVVHSQNNILITTNVFSEHGNRSSVVWELSYYNDVGIQYWADTYLIELNYVGKCIYFHQTEERQLILL